VGVVILVLLVDVVWCIYLLGLFVCLFVVLFVVCCCCYGEEIKKEINAAGASEVIYESSVTGER
jgi:hypothetical protein